MNEDLKALISKDFHRYGINKVTSRVIFKSILFSRTPGLRFMCVLRLLQFYLVRSRVLAAPFYLIYKRLKYKYGFDISYRTKVGPGLYLGHFGGVVIHGDTVIGDNCNLSHGVTIGISNHGKRKGIPNIGNCVFIGPGSVILGKIRVGNNVTIGANTVVNFDVPDNATVINNGSKIIDKDLSDYYIHNPS